MKKPKVFIIILNYNGKDFLSSCLESVLKIDYPNFEVVVVDNNSSDGSFEDARKIFPKFHYIKNNRNRGFSGGNNVAIRWALEKMADYILLLNNDATIEKDSLRKMIEVAESDKRAGIFSPTIYKGDSREIWFDGGRIDWMRMKTTHKSNKAIKHKNNNFIQNSSAAADKIKNSEYITGCAMLIKKEVFKKIGLLDEDYFLYYEDADFSYRADEAGFDLKIISDTSVFHYEKSSDNPKKVYWLVYSGLIFFKKNTPWLWRPWIIFYTFLRKIKNKISLKNKEKYSIDIKKAFEDFEVFKRGGR